MRIRFVDEAGAEFLDGIEYYETQRPKFGRRFKVEVEQTLLWLVEHSEACRLRPGGYRRLNCGSFLITFHTFVRGLTLWVLAIAHQRRKPEYWIRREKII